MPRTRQPTEQKVLAEVPCFSSDSQIDSLFKTKLRLESVLEASRNPKLPEVAIEDRAQLLHSTLEASLHDNSRALLYYQQMEKDLDTKQQRFNKLMGHLEAVKTELVKPSSLPTPHAEHLLLIETDKQSRAAFNACRNKFRELLQRLDNKQPELNISEVLQSLFDRMMTHPNDPYLDVDDINCTDPGLKFLLNLNLAKRHSHDKKQIRLIDPRRT